jgi:hypothetical protein
MKWSFISSKQVILWVGSSLSQIHNHAFDIKNLSLEFIFACFVWVIIRYVKENMYPHAKKCFCVMAYDICGYSHDTSPLQHTTSPTSSFAASYPLFPGWLVGAAGEIREDCPAWCKCNCLSISTLSACYSYSPQNTSHMLGLRILFHKQFFWYLSQMSLAHQQYI